MDLEIGSTLGDYQVVGILGAGGMGKVYKVRNVISDRIEAMKVLLPDLANAPELADRFLREIKVQASLEHPNIASLHTALRVDNQLLMLMECVDGMTLDQRLKNGPIPVADAVEYIRQVLAALDYAHAHGVVHRDIKPANMMLTANAAVKLMDFGIAKASTDNKLTMTGTTLGSLYYMSPEQIQGASNLDARSDLYSVGVSLYELVTGKRPFDGDSQFAIMSAHLQQNPVPPIALDPALPQALNDAILMAVSKDPNARFQTAGAFRNALGNVVPAAAPPQPVAAAVAAPSAQPTAPLPENYRMVQPTPPAASRGHRGMWMAMGAVAMAAVAVAVIQFGPWRHTKAAPPQPVLTAPATQIPAQPEPAPQSPPQTVPAATTPEAPASAPPAAAATALTKPQKAASYGSPAASPQPRQPSHTTGQSTSSAPQSEPQAPPQQAQQQALPQQPAAPAVDPAKLQEAREEFAMMNARASGIHSSLQSMRSSMARQGLNLRGDIQTAATMLDTYMRSANDALAAGDLAQGKGFMDKAETQLGILEKFLNR
jgi:hypothetical protein